MTLLDSNNFELSIFNFHNTQPSEAKSMQQQGMVNLSNQFDCYRDKIYFTCIGCINQSSKQDRGKDDVYLKTSPSQSSAHGVTHDSGRVLAHTGVARQQPGLYRNKVTSCIL